MVRPLTGSCGPVPTCPFGIGAGPISVQNAGSIDGISRSARSSSRMARLRGSY
jgi:hypothetical protein